MTPAEKEQLIETKILQMKHDCKALNNAILKRQTLIDANSKKNSKESEEKMSSLSNIRQNQSRSRTARNDVKEQARHKVSRTLMANLVSAADYPDAPSYIPPLMDFLKNILGNLNLA